MCGKNVPFLKVIDNKKGDTFLYRLVVAGTGLEPMTFGL